MHFQVDKGPQTMGLCVSLTQGFTLQLGYEKPKGESLTTFHKSFYTKNRGHL